MTILNVDRQPLSSSSTFITIPPTTPISTTDSTMSDVTLSSTNSTSSSSISPQTPTENVSLLPAATIPNSKECSTNESIDGRETLVTDYTSDIATSASPSVPFAASLVAESLLITPSTCASSPTPVIRDDATTFFDDVVNARLRLSARCNADTCNLDSSPGVSLPDIYRKFFDNYPELCCDSEFSTSDVDMEMEMDLEMEEADEIIPAVRAHTLAAMRQANDANNISQVPLIADRHSKLETIDTINLMNHPQQPQQNLQQQNGSGAHSHGQHNHTNGNDNSANSHKNNNNSDEQGSGSSPDQSQSQQPQRRKKASRACFHCQKAHLTCDDSRPCQRCVKRDLAATCADGVRKKAKYLQDAYDAQQLAAGQANQNGQNGSSAEINRIDQQLLTDQDQQQRQGTGSLEGPLSDPNALFNFPMSSDYGFGSEAVNLEYSIISTMLSSPTAELNNMSDLSIVENWQRQGLDAMASMANSNQLQKALGAAAAAAAAAAAGSGSGVGSNNVTGVLANGTNPSAQSNNNALNNTTGILGQGAQPVNTTNNTAPFQHPGVSRVSKRKFPSNTPENVYANTKQPFNYTDGFHYLLRYVRERMDKEEMMRICRAMAMFRPSFIALIMNLTPEDLIFMEKCFQRTILEFEKLISFSGTPTVVWRRTGEIALVGKEFSLLTQWGRDQLVGKKTYIYELMDNQSAVEYWEKFSTHAFENTEQTVMTTCILLSPTNRVVPCTFCFTIKRDIFDIPLAIVGNFLPILS